MSCSMSDCRPQSPQVSLAGAASAGNLGLPQSAVATGQTLAETTSPRAVLSRLPSPRPSRSSSPAGADAGISGIPGAIEQVSSPPPSSPPALPTLHECPLGPHKPLTTEPEPGKCLRANPFQQHSGIVPESMASLRGPTITKTTLKPGLARLRPSSPPQLLEPPENPCKEAPLPVAPSAEAVGAAFSSPSSLPPTQKIGGIRIEYRRKRAAPLVEESEKSAKKVHLFSAFRLESPATTEGPNAHRPPPDSRSSSDEPIRTLS
ncbi:uncharacterized protein BJ171DRAFT_565049, partial [Polychytrium aggregatum]|uniref:uncharacterized protein n=1 Tax=Polychytrium aggregatum TaxID=110093 RepID=UPI0022FEF734